MENNPLIPDKEKIPKPEYIILRKEIFLESSIYLKASNKTFLVKDVLDFPVSNLEEVRIKKLKNRDSQGNLLADFQVIIQGDSRSGSLNDVKIKKEYESEVEKLFSK